jgi:hypothetical protein
MDQRASARSAASTTPNSRSGLAAVKPEKFLDPRGVRSICSTPARATPYTPPELPNYAFEENRCSTRTAGRSARAACCGQAAVQPEPVDPGAEHPVAPQHLVCRARANVAGGACLRSAALRCSTISSPKRRGWASGQEPKMQVESLTSRSEFNERRARASAQSLQARGRTRRVAPVRETRAPEEPSRERARTRGEPARPVRPPAPAAPAERPGQRSRRRRRGVQTRHRLGREDERRRQSTGRVTVRRGVTSRLRGTRRRRSRVRRPVRLRSNGSDPGSSDQEP